MTTSREAATPPRSERYDAGMRAATTWLAAQFPHVSHNDRAPIVHGIAAVLWPHLTLAATCDMADELAGQFPEIAEALDRSAAARLQELQRTPR